MQQNPETEGTSNSLILPLIVVLGHLLRANVLLLPYASFAKIVSCCYTVNMSKHAPLYVQF